MDNRRIGIFDSGLGGLSCVKQIMEQMPKESIVYFGDTGRVPYGSRSKETIIKYTKDDIDLLLKHDIKLIISACGTASSVALGEIKDDYSVPVIGVVEPSARAAAKISKNKKIGIIGTSGTIASGKYEECLLSIDKSLSIFAAPCPLFVPLVENGHIDTEVTKLIAEEYLLPLANKGVDTLILGCTHYPLLRRVISSVMGDGVSLIDSGAEAAKYAKELLTKSNQLCENKETSYEFYVSDSPESFSRLGGTFLERDIDFFVKKVEIN